MAAKDRESQPSQNDDQGLTTEDYLTKAAQAVQAGKTQLAMHLYLTAFERSKRPEGDTPHEAAIEGLKKAWALACSLKERSLAEYVFEQMEPYLSSDEVEACAAQLQDLAFDKLQEYGLSREELEDMSDLISQDLMGLNVSSLFDITPKGQSSVPSAQPETDVADKPSCSKDEVHVEQIERLDFSSLVGYDRAIKMVNDFGIGLQNDPQFLAFVESLNKHHGLDSMPACDTLIFRSPAREDSNRFVSAVLGELGLPAVRMHMEENMQGLPVLCVMAQADNQPNLNRVRNGFEGPGILVMEDLDEWMAPMAEQVPDDFAGFLMASLSRGAREAVNLIRSAVENPEVYVLATMSSSGEIDEFFFDLLDPVTVLDIDYPNGAERSDIWMEIARSHPSLRGINRENLVRLSANMPRFDIYMAAREALDEAYKASLVEKSFVPVTADNLFDKLAAYQPLDSDEYLELEEAVVSNFKRDLDHLEDLLD